MVVVVVEETLCDINCGFCLTALPCNDVSHILHSVSGMLPSSSLPLRNSEEMRSDTWKCYSAVTSSGYKMVLEGAENSAARSIFCFVQLMSYHVQYNLKYKAASRQHCFVIHLTLLALSELTGFVTWSDVNFLILLSPASQDTYSRGNYSTSSK